VIERRLQSQYGLDQTRTVGLVTLPGAFVGVLLGGGTPIQAGAAQVLVLVGLLAAETVTVVVADQLMKTSRLLPPDLRSRLVANPTASDRPVLRREGFGVVASVQTRGHAPVTLSDLDQQWRGEAAFDLGMPGCSTTIIDQPSGWSQAAVGGGQIPGPPHPHHIFTRLG
jgi:hypothetical protein